MCDDRLLMVHYDNKGAQRVENVLKMMGGWCSTICTSINRERETRQGSCKVLTVTPLQDRFE
jgi:hypothetical protein